MLELFAGNYIIIGLVFLLIFIYNGIVFIAGGKQAESRFPKLESQNVIFREKGVSGHSKASFISRFGGAKRTIEVVVTEEELWVKGIFPSFSYIASKFDLLHKIPLSHIDMMNVTGNIVELKFKNETGLESHIELKINRTEDFESAVNG